MNTEDHSLSLPATVNPVWRIGIVHALYYKEDVDRMVTSAVETLVEAGIRRENVTLYPVAGSFEIPCIGAVLAEKRMADALIGFGIIVEGETHHAALIAQQVVRGVMNVQTRLHTPFAFEVLYVHSIADAQQRCVSRGKEAAIAILHSLAQVQGLLS
ncbi:MAG: 6,7-dimethyl-8-ribityllumazine synthase [Candidatus Peribacteraceae bacterium]